MYCKSLTPNAEYTLQAAAADVNMSWPFSNPSDWGVFGI